MDTIVLLHMFYVMKNLVVDLFSSACSTTQPCSLPCSHLVSLQTLEDKEECGNYVHGPGLLLPLTFSFLLQLSCVPQLFPYALRKKTCQKQTGYRMVNDDRPFEFCLLFFCQFSL